ncbi:hypothetical protein BUALT_Bualt10G0027000 [Buddleja alternifolia]|uniref:Uncharacterized protein n=1 Tax=Buddleja alternifolia TaxID=168488 RepID=A0AAV6X2U5_9LAMI|nr:hypothetical protein BUALT_Bualt10G0027000 [Buddleja alternifolia]
MSKTVGGVFVVGPNIRMKTSGLSIIRNSICCEDHFEWHRMNCLNADAEDNAYIFKNKRERNNKSVQLSDLIF